MTAIIYDLIKEYELIGGDERRRISALLVGAINRALEQYHSSITVPSGLSGTMTALAKRIPVCAESLSMIWQACQYVNIGIRPLPPNTIDSIIHTAPDELHIPANLDADILEQGSLLRNTASLIEQCKHELIIISPYWSLDGIKRLLRQLPNNLDKLGATLSLLTPRVMDLRSLKGFHYFCEWAESIGFEVRQREPRMIAGKNAPMVHAKMIIADGECAYIGSANFTDFGFAHSIEIGVQISGPVVTHLQKWTHDLDRHFVDKGTQPN